MLVVTAIDTSTLTLSAIKKPEKVNTECHNGGVILARGMTEQAFVHLRASWLSCFKTTIAIRQPVKIVVEICNQASVNRQQKRTGRTWPGITSAFCPCFS